MVLISLFWLAQVWFTPAAHDFHASITEMEYNPERQRLEVSMKLFSNDLEADITRHVDPEFAIGDYADSLRNERLQQYLRSRFRVSSAQKTHEWSWVGSQVDINVTFLFLEVPMPGKPEILEIENSVLLERFADQVNIVNLEWGDFRGSLLLKPDHPVEQLTIE